MDPLDAAFHRLGITPTDFQWAASSTIVHRDEDVLGVAPTGSGKSEVYLSAALALQPKITVVVSPLLALIRDQVRRCHRYEIPAVAVHGSVTPKQRQHAIEWIEDGQAALVITTPETLRNKDDLSNALHRRGVGLLAIDEAHVIQDWGDSFRPAYAWLSMIARKIQPRRVAVFSATLTADAALLAARSVGRWKWSAIALPAARPNLHFAVEPLKKGRSLQRVARLWTNEVDAPGNVKVAGQKAIIYGRSVRFVEQAVDELRRIFGKTSPSQAVAYHADLRRKQRNEVEKKFVEGDPTILCATTAFGMGVDVPDIRMVVHGQLPPSVVEYLQEAGRAGRDHQDALCLLFADHAARASQFFVRQTFPSLEKLKAVDEVLQNLLPNGEERALAASAVAEAADLDVPTVRASLGWLDSSGLIRKRPAAKTWTMTILNEPSARAPKQQEFVRALRKRGRQLLSKPNEEVYEVTGWALDSEMKGWRGPMAAARNARVVLSQRPAPASRLQVIPHDFAHDFNPQRLTGARDRAQARLEEMRAYLEVEGGTEERADYLQRAVGLEVERLHDLICSEVPNGQVKVLKVKGGRPGVVHSGAQAPQGLAPEVDDRSKVGPQSGPPPADPLVERDWEEVRAVEERKLGREIPKVTSEGPVDVVTEDFVTGERTTERLERRPVLQHHCHAKGCKKAVAPKLLMCPMHWRMVPKVLADRVWATYRPGQERDKNPSEAYLKAADAAIKAVWERERSGTREPVDPEAVRREAYEERAAIMEFDGGLSREEAEAAARAEVWPEPVEEAVGLGGEGDPYEMGLGGEGDPTA